MRMEDHVVAPGQIGTMDVKNGHVKHAQIKQCLDKKIGIHFPGL